VENQVLSLSRRPVDAQSPQRHWDVHQDGWNIKQTGDARFINFCYYKKGKPAGCTRTADASAFPHGSFDLVTFNQDSASEVGVFNFDLPKNLNLVGGTLVKGAPWQFVNQVQPGGYVTLYIDIGNGTDLCKLQGTKNSTEYPIDRGEAKVTPGAQ
jgi:hypothetical protein